MSAAAAFEFGHLIQMESRKYRTKANAIKRDNVFKDVFEEIEKEDTPLAPSIHRYYDKYNLQEDLNREEDSSFSFDLSNIWDEAILPKLI